MEFVWRTNRFSSEKEKRTKNIFSTIIIHFEGRKFQKRLGIAKIK